jgi:hypothetical protein
MTGSEANNKGAQMVQETAQTVDETNVDELGPIDWIVVEFPGSRFNGEIAPALADLVDRDLIRVLDLLVLKRFGVRRPSWPM